MLWVCVCFQACECVCVFRHDYKYRLGQMGAALELKQCHGGFPGECAIRIWGWSCWGITRERTKGSWLGGRLCEGLLSVSFSKVKQRINGSRRNDWEIRICGCSMRFLKIDNDCERSCLLSHERHQSSWPQGERTDQGPGWGWCSELLCDKFIKV